MTSTGMVVGSPGFMSPEQAEGHEVGPPSDVFSLGAVLAFAATGEGPFGTGSSAALHVPAGPQPAGPGPGARRDPVPDRALPGQGSRPAAQPRANSWPNSAMPASRPDGCPNRSSRDVGPPGPAARSVLRRAAPPHGFGPAPDRAPGPAHGHQRAPERPTTPPWPGCHRRRTPGGRRPAGGRRPLVIAGTRGRAGRGGRRGNRRGRHRGRQAPGRAGRAEGADPGDRVALPPGCRLGVGHAAPAAGPRPAERARNADRVAHGHRDGSSKAKASPTARHQEGIGPQPGAPHRYLDRYLRLPARLRPGSGWCSRRPRAAA